jgi:hypothetical protein
MIATASSPDELMVKLYQDVDRMDAKAYVSHFAADGELTFANAETVVGRDAIEEAIAGFFASIGGISHELSGVWEVDDVIFCQVLVTYVRKDGSSLTLPAASLGRMSSNLISEFRIYVDLGPLFSGGTE